MSTGYGPAGRVPCVYGAPCGRVYGPAGRVYGPVGRVYEPPIFSRACSAHACARNAAAAAKPVAHRLNNAIHATLVAPA